MTPLRHVEPPETSSVLARFYGWVAATKVVRLLSRLISWRIDPLLLRVSGGRLCSTLIFPAAVLETTGARSGKRRRHAVIYFHDGSDVIILASNAGSPRHPSWYHNLRRHAAVALGGVAMSAEEVLDEHERRRLWDGAVRVFPAYERYRRDAAEVGRKIPIIRMRPVPGPHPR